MHFQCQTKDAENGALEVVFKLEYSDEPLVILDRHMLPVGVEAFFSRFSMYVSDISLSGDEDILLEDIRFVNMTNDHLDLDGAVKGTRLLFDEVEPGDYQQLHFGIGVPPALNASTPVDFGSDHPLARPGEYWTGWKSYIFFKIEGKMDQDGDGEYETGIALHIGSDDAFRMKEMQVPITILPEQTTTVELIIDLRDVLKSGAETYDIIGTPQIHTLQQIDQAVELAENLQNAIQL